MLRPVDTLGYADDSTLVERCRRGDRSAQRHLFRAHFSRVHGTLYRIFRSAHETDDLAQETFLEVFRSLHGFKGEARLATWIDRIAVRVAFRHLGHRKERLVPIELVGEVPEDRAGPDRQASAREGMRRLYEVLATMRREARLAFVLHTIDGRTIAETARLTGSTAVATKVRIWRARQTVERQAARDPVLSLFLDHAAPDGAAG